jgi:hypothetical protein
MATACEASACWSQPARGSLRTAEIGEQETTDVEYEFVPRQGEFASMPGRVARGPLRWTAAKEGTYVAFGRAPPIDEPRFIAVVDAGFPAWLQDEARALLPRLFNHFAAALGQELPGRPTVLLSYGDAEQAGTLSLKGGTLPGLLLQQDVQLGNARRGTSDQQVLNGFRGTLAHESAHLWNIRLAHNRGPDWVHEGGADLLAFRALRALGPGHRGGLGGPALASTARGQLRRRDVFRGL